MSSLSIEVTSICSFNCYFCNEGRRKKYILSTDVFKRVVDEALELGYDSFVLTPKNGDVFCDPEIYEKLDYLRTIRAPYHFITNLHLVEPKKLIKVMSPLGKIYYSEYGKSDEEFEKLTRKPRSFRHKVLENFEILKNFISKFEINGEYISSCESSRAPREIASKRFCTEAYNHAISSNGDVILCTCGTYNPDLIVGNIIDSSLKDVFTSSRYRDKIKYLIKNGMDNRICQDVCNNFRTNVSPRQMLRNMRL